MEQQAWTPTFPGFDEGKISLESDTLMLTRNSREICAIVQTDADSYEGNGAVFWIDMEHIYLRYNWRTWYPLSNDNPDISKDITRRYSMTLNIYSGNDCKSFPLPIFHIGELPECLFKTEAPVPPPDITENISDDLDGNDQEEGCGGEDGEGNEDGEEEAGVNEVNEDEKNEENEFQPFRLASSSVKYEDADTLYTSFVNVFGQDAVSRKKVPTTYDAFLMKSSIKSWARSFSKFQDDLARKHVSHFPHVKLNGGWVEHAFSNDKTAILIQVYKGAAHLRSQCQELAAVASELIRNEEDCTVISGIFFAGDLPLPDLPDGDIQKFTPESLRELVALYPDESP